MGRRRWGVEVKLIERVLAWDNLERAWTEVAEKGGTAGVDRVSIRRWARNWEERLVNLAAAVRANTYRPSRLRQYRIPKASGGMRRIGNPTVTDKVLQRAVLRVLDDIFDPQFLDCSYGYRRGLGVRDAVRAIVCHRVSGLEWVLDADVDECFDSLDHGLLVGFVREEVDDPIVLRLIEQWLEVGRPDPEVPKGIALGAVISPLLCNVYLHRLDRRLVQWGYAPVRYADDFCVFCADRAEAERAWQDTAEVLAELELALEPSKTGITHFDEGFDYLGVRFYRDTYSFISQGKRIEVEGDYDPVLFHDYVPDGYRS